MLVFGIGAAVGVFNCLLCAVLFKRSNLGLFWNSVTGVLVGGIGASVLYALFPEFDFIHVVIAGACVLVMFTVSNILDARAR